MDSYCLASLLVDLTSHCGKNRLTVCDNRVLRKRDEVTVEWRRLHNEELCDLCSSPNIIGVIKSENEIGGGTREMRTEFWRENLKERGCLEEARIR